MALTSILKFGDFLYYSDYLFSEYSFIAEKFHQSSIILEFNIFNFINSSFAIKAILILLILNSITLFFTKDKFAKISLILNLYFLISFQNQNFFVFNYPTFSMFCFSYFWLILFKFSSNEYKEILNEYSWWAVTIPFTISGLDKIGSISWANGTAVAAIAKLNWSHSIVGNFFLTLPNFFQKSATYIFWIMEIFSIAFIYWRKARSFYIIFFILTFVLASSLIPYYFVGLDAIPFFLVLMSERSSCKNIEDAK